MKFRLTKHVRFTLSALGLVLLTMGFTGESQTHPNPCPDSSAIYVNGEFVECLNSKKKSRARP